MKYLLLMLLMVLPPVAIAGDQIWRWVDDEGTVHFSDEYREGAEEVQRRALPTMQAPPPAPRRDAPPREQRPRYESLRIASPETDDVILANDGRIPVVVEVSDSLSTGHRIVILLDGEEVARGASATLTDVRRGSYTLQAVIQDQQGREIAASEAIPFHVRQHSRLYSPSAP